MIDLHISQILNFRQYVLDMLRVLVGAREYHKESDINFMILSREAEPKNDIAFSAVSFGFGTIPAERVKHEEWLLGKFPQTTSGVTIPVLSINEHLVLNCFEMVFLGHPYQEIDQAVLNVLRHHSPKGVEILNYSCFWGNKSDSFDSKLGLVLRIDTGLEVPTQLEVTTSAVWPKGNESHRPNVTMMIEMVPHPSEA